MCEKSGQKFVTISITSRSTLLSFCQIRSIDPVGAARERARLRALDRALKREQIGFAMRDRLDDGVEPECVGFVAIERDVLEHRDDALRLRADDRLCRDAVALSRDDILVVHLPGELAEGLVGSQAAPGTGSNQRG